MIFALVWSILKKNIRFRFFSGKIVTSLADIITMEKKNLFNLKLLSGIQFLFVNRFSKKLWHFFKTFGMQNADMVICFLKCSFWKMVYRQ